MSIITNEFIPPKPLETAVLFLVFNRLDTTKQVFESIQKAKPPRIYVASDGARDNKDGENIVVDKVREYVINNIDWNCEVKTLFRDKNLGCKHAVGEAISWFFKDEEKGIILEDDCLPSQSFFWFCEELLERYKNDMRVWHIGGNNFQFDWQRDKDYSYYFSYYPHIWGWASWSDRWSSYSYKMNGYSEIKKKKYFQDIFCNKVEAKYKSNNFNEIIYGLNTWDYQWHYTIFINSGLSILPKTNLVSNLGFGQGATHTKSKNNKIANMAYNNIDFPLSHPFFVIRDKVSDDRFFKKIIHTRTNRIKRIIKKILRKLI